MKRTPRCIISAPDEGVLITEVSAATGSRHWVERFSVRAGDVLHRRGAICAIHHRMAPLLVALRDAATTDTESRQVWRYISDRRARNMRDLVRDLGPHGTLRVDVILDEAADVIWATASPELFILLTEERGWTHHTYEQWLADSWTRLLLPSNRQHVDPPPR